MAGGLLVLFLGMYSWNQRTHTLDDIAANVGLEMSGTVLGTFDSVKGSVMDAWRRYVDLVGVREENERLRREFTANVSHELKTPLAALRLYTEMDAPAHAARTLAAIERMERLVYSLLRLERLRAGAYPFSFQAHSLAAIARGSIAEVAALFPDRAFSLEGDARVRCDAHWLGEAIDNLLKNACEHTPGGGRVFVRVEQAESTARVSVEDEGGGVPPGEEERLFERFYRRGGADAPGAGVGLNIVRAIAEQHHGAAWAENAQKGLRVTISLPLLPLLKESAQVPLPAAS